MFTYETDFVPSINMEQIFHDSELNIENEYSKLKRKMENVLGNIDPRMPRNYLIRALEETITNFERYNEESFPE